MPMLSSAATNGRSFSLDRVSSVARSLATYAEEVDRKGVWPAESLRCCREADVFRWFLPHNHGGWGWSEEELVESYLALSQGCLTTTFILTQWHAACRRICASANQLLCERLIPGLADGEQFATVGISQLSTSRQHSEQPPLRATKVAQGYQLDGYSPWVTGAAHADLLVLGATVEDGRQVLLVVPADQSGITRYPGLELIALSASCTDRVELDRVFVDESMCLAGPEVDVLQGKGIAGGTGGLATSTLAVGLAQSAVNYLIAEARQRDYLLPIATEFQLQTERLRQQLLLASTGRGELSATKLRHLANSLVLRVTQAALQGAKGTGFVRGHPAGRWAREALFFLVWSCPPAVSQAQLCELVVEIAKHDSDQ